MLWLIALITVIVFAIFMLGANSMDRPERDRLEDDEDFLFFAEEDTEEK